MLVFEGESMWKAIHIPNSTTAYLLFAPAILLAGGLGCTVHSVNQMPDSQVPISGSPPTSVDSQQQVLPVPPEGTPGDKIRSLWARSLPSIQSDAAAGLTDNQYLYFRDSLLKPWLVLQSEFAHPLAIAPERITSEVITLIDTVYGYPGYPQETRERNRRTFDLRSAVAALNEKIQDLP